MFDTKDFDAKITGLEQKLQTALGIRGKSLQARLDRAGRLLPKRLKAEGRILLETQKKTIHPKLTMQVNSDRVAKAFAEFDAYLKGINPSDLRKGKLLSWLGGLIFNFIIFAVLLAVFLRWQGGN